MEDGVDAYQPSIFVPKLADLNCETRLFSEPLDFRKIAIHRMETIEQILIVDDETEFVNMFRRHLRRKGFSVDSASDGKEACYKIQGAGSRGLPFDHVITDDIMPNVGGIELLEWIKETHPGISVIVVSGFWHTNMVMEAIRPEMDNYAQMPLTPHEVMQLIGNIDLKRRHCSAAPQEEKA